MACPLILYFFLTLTVLPVCNPLTSYQVDVNIFVKNNDTEMRYIVQEATGLFHLENGNISLKNGEGKIQVNLRTVSYNEVISSIFTLDQDLVFNITVSLRSAIFVQISNHEIFLSSLMEGSNIVAVGLFQTKANPFSQVRSLAKTLFFRGRWKLRCSDTRTILHKWIIYISLLALQNRNKGRLSMPLLFKFFLHCCGDVKLIFFFKFLAVCNLMNVFYYNWFGISSVLCLQLKIYHLAKSRLAFSTLWDITKKYEPVVSYHLNSKRNIANCYPKTHLFQGNSRTGG